MPALEVLDLSRNRIRSMPEHPGFLSNLRVCCFSESCGTFLPTLTGLFLVKEQDHCSANLYQPVSKFTDLKSGSESV